MLKVYYDGCIYVHQANGGINRYFANIISRLPREALPVLYSTTAQIANPPCHANLRWDVHTRFNLPRPFGRIGRFLGRQALSRYLSKGHADILHPTYYTLLYGLQLQRLKVPVVLTVYDMIHERFADLLDPRGETAHAKGLAVRHAQAIICISNKTRDDLLEYHPVDPNKVTVIPLATEMGPAPAAPPAQSLESPYFLFVGARTSYKNFDRLLQAFGRVRVHWPQLKLIAVGTPFTPAELKRLADLGLSDLVLSIACASDADLTRLYQQSVALVYPSLYEGFGIPLLEAMACGTAALASNASCLPEVAGDAALLFDPTDIDAISQAMLAMLEQPTARTALIAKGLERVKLFSWERTAAQTMDVYRKVLAA